MTTFDELPFELHMKIFDLCIGKKEEYLEKNALCLMKEFHSLKKKHSRYNDMYVMTKLLKESKNDYSHMGTTEYIIKRYNFLKWSNPSIFIHYTLIVIDNRFHQITYKINDKCKYKEKEAVILNILMGNIHLVCEGQKKKINLDKFYNMNKNDNYYL